VVLEKRAVQIENTRADAGYDKDLAARLHFRRILGVPLLGGGEVVGVITVGWAEPGPIEPRHEELLKTFAAQAVIAIENVRLFKELQSSNSSLREALEQQTATAEILRVISSTPTDVQPVFDAIVQSGLKLFPDAAVVVCLPDGGHMRLAAAATANEADAAALRSRFPIPLTREYMNSVAVLDRRVIDLPDATINADPSLAPGVANFLATGLRAITIMPMVRGDAAIGTISVVRRTPGPLTDKQIALLRTFADQAVIAIENARLFNETKEALERQTATAEILRVIASSPSDVQPVLEAIVRSASQLFSPCNASIFMRDGNLLQHRAMDGTTVDERLREEVNRIYPVPFDPASSTSARAMVERRANTCTDTEAPGVSDHIRRAGRAGRFRSNTVVPLVRDDEGIGTIVLTYPQPGYTLSEKQLALLRTFADQAVIAIENARLFNETKEALERQTATADILGVISRSPSDIEPVLQAVAERAALLCEATDVHIRLVQGELMPPAVQLGSIPVDEESKVQRVTRESVPGRAILECRTIHIHDIQQPEVRSEYPEALFFKRPDPGFRTMLVVPLVRGAAAIGSITVRRAQMRPFSEQQIALLKTFADQAVIAIENTRLFKELQERTEALTKSVGQLTALGEVGQAISSTLDLEKVLKTIVARAVQLAELDAGWIYEFDERDERFHLRAAEHVEEEILQVSRAPLRLGEGAVGRAGATREPVVVEDVLDESYQSRVRELLIKSGSRALLAVPLLREDLLLGALVVSRNSPGPFASEVVDLLKTFATQSAVAIQNARLFNETNEALEQQKAMAEVLAVISSSIADTKPVFEKILESCQRVFAGRNVGITVVGDDAKVHLGAYKGHGRAEFEAFYPVPLNMESGSGAAILQRQVVHYPDCDGAGVPQYARRGAQIAGNKSVLLAPMLWEGKGLGAIFVGRPVTGAFSEKEISLLRTFADQAAIAIQNARLIREIEDKGRQLEVASHHKSQFLASMSHELRTPLNAILGFNEMMLDGLCGEVPAGFKDPLDETQKSGKHLLRLINNVLDLAKIEAGRMELALGDYSVHDTVESVRSTLRPLAAEKGLEFLANVPADIPLAYGDAGRITQCLMNLAGNSLKFTKEGRVEISVQQQNGQLRYCVTDTGIGIPPEKIGSLFTEFKQTDATIASEYGGTGLGLSITKKFVEMHGGRIWVESEIGKGSAFIFEIPLAPGK
jgi:GAF domain-containing protein/anti-sigma regulatory factor (Ser/Thr protein kinase)